MILAILSWGFRIFGFVQWAEALEAKIEQTHKIQEQANAPQTKTEEIDNFGKW